MVERESVSVRHPSRFILVGTMNPEEGELRPQLLDRLPLHIEVSTIFDNEMRIEIMKRNMDFEENPTKFRESLSTEQKNTLNRIMEAKDILSSVKIPDYLLKTIALICISLRTDGHRPELVIAKTSKTLAAYNGRKEVDPEDVLKSAKMTLSHRTRNLGRDPPASENQIEKEFNTALSIVNEQVR